MDPPVILVERAPTGPDCSVALVTNPASGNGDDGHQWPARVRVHPLDECADLVETLRGVVERGADVVGMCGGDGSVGCAAGLAADHDRILWAVPGGTLNHFARQLGMPTIESAVAALEGGTVASIDIGDANGKTFVNNASVGIYGDLVRRREAIQRRSGLGKWPALTLAAVRTLRRATPITLTIDGVVEDAYMVFVGNNPYDGAALGKRTSLQTGLLDLRVLRAKGRFPRLGVVWRMLTGRLEESTRTRHAHVPEVRIVLGEGTSLAYDGEAETTSGEVVFRSRPRAVRVLVPAAPPAE